MSQPERSPIKITLIYGAISSLWIFCSDQVASFFFQDFHLLTYAQTVKGWLFVLASSGLIYYLIQRLLQKIRQEEQQRRKSEARYQFLFDNVNDPIYVYQLNEQGMPEPFLEVNEPACRRHGWNRETFLRKTLLDINSPGQKERIPDRLRQIMETGTAIFETEHITWEGKRIPVEVNVHQFDLEERKTFLSIVRDITERKKFEDAQRLKVEQLTALNETSRYFLQESDESAICHYACRKATEALGCDDAWMACTPLNETNGLSNITYCAYAHDTQPERPTLSHSPAHLAIQTAGTVIQHSIKESREYPEWREETLRRGFRSSAALPLQYDDQVFGVMDFYSVQDHFFEEGILEIFQSLANLTSLSLHRSRLYSQVTNYASDLELRVLERTRLLQEVNEELETYTYSVSHDLRAPLRAIEGISKLLLEEYTSRLDTVGHDYIQRIHGASQRMDDMIQELLHFSRLNRMEIECLPIALDKIVQDSIRMLTPHLEEKAAEIIVQAPLLPVLGNPLVMNNLISNLLTNAVKFTTPGVKPIVRFWTEARENKVRIWVEDNGIGISEKDQTRIFKAFVRLHGVEEYPGSGIGLAIVRRGAERMGGKVGVESTLGQGSRFWIELPCVTPQTLPN